MDPTTWVFAFALASWHTFLAHWPWFLLGALVCFLYLMAFSLARFGAPDNPVDQAMEDQEQHEYLMRWEKDH